MGERWDTAKEVGRMGEGRLRIAQERRMGSGPYLKGQEGLSPRGRGNAWTAITLARLD